MTSWRDLIKVHPAAELFDPLSPEELDTLVEDIRKNGLQNPIATWFDKNEQEWLIDGRNRLDALERLGYKFSLVSHNAGGVCTTSKLKIRNPNARQGVTGHNVTALDVEWLKVAQFRETHTCGTFGWPIADPYELATLYNLHRRHLSKDAQKDAAAKLLKANPERSDRSIAEDTGLSPTTVGKIRDKVEAANVHDGHKADRVEASGRKARGRKPGAKPDFDPRGSSPTTPAAPAAAEPRKPIWEPVPDTRSSRFMTATENAIALAADDRLTVLKGIWAELPTEERLQFLSWVHEQDADFYHRGCPSVRKRKPAAEPEAVVEPEPQAAATPPQDPPMAEWSAEAGEPGDRVQRLNARFNGFPEDRQSWLRKWFQSPEEGIAKCGVNNPAWARERDWLTGFIALSDDELAQVRSQLEEPAA